MTVREKAIQEIIKENERRNAEIYAKFDPVTGYGSVGERKKIVIDDFPIQTQWVPVEMMKVPLVRQLVECGSIRAFLTDCMEVKYNEADRLKVIEQFVRLRYRYDFAFWAATLVYIKNKDGGDDVLFRLTRPQRRFVERLEKLRKAGKPIRIVLLKARQWGGSTTSQIYMAWLQLIHKVGLNSLIIAHQGTGSDEIKDMFDRMIKAYPVEMLHELSEAYKENEPKLVGVGKSGSIYRVPQRNCKIKIGTAERPDGCRGGDYSLVHLSEVGLWKATEGKKPEDIVRSACSGVLYRPYTMIVYESTANGTGNFFQREYDAAKKGDSQFEAMFVSWFDIEKYSQPLDDIKAFAARLYDNRENANVSSAREESGRYLWALWEKGATLEAINWYILERAKYNDHASMASEYPSDDIEAFVHSGTMVFDKYKVEDFDRYCKKPRYVGDVYADADEGKNALKNLRFSEDRQGMLWVWELPEVDESEKVLNRYLTVVDVGGRSNKADWSVIVVFDRLFMADGGKPVVVAQWYGHCDIDLLAWKAAQIAAFYDNSLLVIESNTLETHDKERDVDGDQSQFILNQIKNVYPNLYARKQSEEDIMAGLPTKYGFHTNVATKPMVISTLVKAIRENAYIERDRRCLDEYLVYEKKPNGAFGAVVGKHDDLLMTRAIGLHICFYEMEPPKFVKRTKRMLVKKKKAVSAATI
ncbi:MULTISPECIES: terminase [Mediterranea]|uniref:terminase n=1 Tax=Mediterranea TaxID=1926659 RepID=UPI00201374F9|nr:MULTISPECIES: terminase [Mediterranea]MCL1606692.1 terminase [Mediterranea sp. ET5]MDM8122738.1 terminase [Mediterranea massiliensis]MDM8197194.1 terminase [Mediterranea massiliensis]